MQFKFALTALLTAAVTSVLAAPAPNPIAAPAPQTTCTPKGSKCNKPFDDTPPPQKKMHFKLALTALLTAAATSVLAAPAPNPVAAPAPQTTCTGVGQKCNSA
ncbi:hypothetical protein FRC05_001450 [Tulasnella sp. 425]|nr:hypothetical protein FRC05_001450 [Tulasnella sp. 425]